jgi:uncharacterized protein YndB with AHSA1/START domain
MPLNLVATASTIIDASALRVWSVITDEARLGELMMGARIETDWKVGSPITWNGEYRGTTFEDKGEILKVEPGRELVYTHFSASSGLEDVPENRHTLTWILDSRDRHTVLTLKQDQNHTSEEVAMATQTWEQLLTGVKDSVEGR